MLTVPAIDPCKPSVYKYFAQESKESDLLIGFGGKMAFFLSNPDVFLLEGFVRLGAGLAWKFRSFSQKPY
jgi:hypothetical protein